MQACISRLLRFLLLLSSDKEFEYMHTCELFAKNPKISQSPAISGSKEIY